MTDKQKVAALQAAAQAFEKALNDLGRDGVGVQVDHRSAAFSELQHKHDRYLHTLKVRLEVPLEDAT